MIYDLLLLMNTGKLERIHLIHVMKYWCPLRMWKKYYLMKVHR